MGVPSGKARCCIPSQSSIINQSSIIPSQSLITPSQYSVITSISSPTVLTVVPIGEPVSEPVSSSNLGSPTDLSITSSHFPSSISTLASIIPKTISTSPTGISSSTNHTTTTNGNLPIIISISIFSTLLIGALLFAYIRSRHKRQRQNALATAIIAAEAGLDDNGIRVGDIQNISASPSPSPPPPPPTPPSTPTPTEPSAIAISQPRSPPRYKISTLQIEPMTRRLTMNLHQKGKSIVVNDDNDVDTDHVVNVVSISEGVDLESSDDDDDAGGSSGSRKRTKRNFKFW